jgi:hypothetical protein
MLLTIRMWYKLTKGYSPGLRSKSWLILIILSFHVWVCSKLRSIKPVVASMVDVAASGG